MPTPLLRLIYTIIFCGLSLVVAHFISLFLVELQIIDASSKTSTHTLIMIAALIIFYYSKPFRPDKNANEI